MKFYFTEDIFILATDKMPLPCADPESFARGVPTLLTMFIFDEGREDSNSTRRGPFRWRADDGPTLNAGLVVL